MWTIILLVLSNVFMNFAWYGHLKFKSTPMWIAILASWGLAFFEYCLQVPANRLGYFGEPGMATAGESGPFNAAQLKTVQEIITLVVFCGVSILWLREPIRWNHAAAFGLIVLAVMLVFKK